MEAEHEVVSYRGGIVVIMGIIVERFFKFPYVLLIKI